MIRCVLCGNSSVGKTSLLVALHGHCPRYTQATIGAAYMRYRTLDVWDTAGQEEYHALLPLYFRSAQVVLVVFDLSHRDSFAATKRWIAEARDKAHAKAMFVLVGTKSDLPERAVTRDEAEKRGTELRATYWETSAVTDGAGVQALFDHVVETATQRFPSAPTTSSSRLQIDGDSHESGFGLRWSSCCSS